MNSAGMETALDHIFAALADPTRRAILMMLLEDDMAVTDVAEPFEMSLAAISKHLSILSKAGLITQDKRCVKWCKPADACAMRAYGCKALASLRRSTSTTEQFLDRNYKIRAFPKLEATNKRVIITPVFAQAIAEVLKSLRRKPF